MRYTCPHATDDSAMCITCMNYEAQLSASRLEVERLVIELKGLRGYCMITFGESHPEMKKCTHELRAEKYREALEKSEEFRKLVVGFCVAFREDNECWEKHQDVGFLFAKATNLVLTPLSEPDGKEGCEK